LNNWLYNIQYKIIGAIIFSKMGLNRVIPSLIGLAIFGTLTAYLLRLFWLGIVSRRWASATGRVMHSNVVNTKGRYSQAKYYVRYSYEVRGRKYTGDRVRFGGTINVNPAHARSTISRYPKDREVVVFYHPRRPNVSTLERKVSGYVFILLPIGLFMTTAICGVLFGWWG
jgi:Protein of unknown function (DUF3592)